MNAKFYLVIVSALLWSTIHLHAEPINALTGTYTGTITRERRLTLDANADRAAKFKQITRVAGFGYVPAGNTRTLIRLILPGRNLRDVGVDKEVVIDFEADPPTVRVTTGATVDPIGFPSVVVQGKNVTITTALGGSTDRVVSDDNCTIELTRTKPE